MAFSSAKRGVKESADYFSGSLQLVRREIGKNYKSFEDALASHKIHKYTFNEGWVKSAIEEYVKKYPPKYRKQIEFLEDLEAHERCIGGAFSPKMIPDVIIKYGYSEFYGLCCSLRESGDDKGDGAIFMLQNIIEDSFREKGLSEILKE